MQTTVLYHANCPDGFGAALACWQQFGDTATYIPVRHNEPPPQIDNGTDIFIVDFSYSRDVLLGIVESAGQSTITILDHHKTAEQELADLHHPRINVHFDMNESGATLAWKFFAERSGDSNTLPLFFQYLRDRDLWLWEIPGSREFSAGLASHPKDFKLWQGFAKNSYLLGQDGAVILRQQDKLVNAICRNAELHDLYGHRVIAVNTPLFASEIGNKLCQEYPDCFAICYSKQADSRWRYELRSIGGFDVSGVAKKHGGGGHLNAAGFISDTLILNVFTKV